MVNSIAVGLVHLQKFEKSNWAELLVLAEFHADLLDVHFVLGDHVQEHQQIHVPVTISLGCCMCHFCLIRYVFSFLYDGVSSVP